MFGMIMIHKNMYSSIPRVCLSQVRTKNKKLKKQKNANGAILMKWHIATMMEVLSSEEPTIKNYPASSNTIILS